MTLLLVDHASSIPPVPEGTPHAFVERTRVSKLIEHPYLAPVTLITAPAGYGKTTLATQWVARQPGMVAWVALDTAANSVDAFIARLAAALDSRDAANANTKPQTPPTVDEFIARLAHRVEAGEAPILVLDDYHLIENRDVHQAMDGLIAHLPSGAHLIVLSRTLPSLSVARLRLEGRVRELTETDLRFTPDEATALIAASAGDRLTREQVSRLAERAQGWIAGLRLALLRLESVQKDEVDSFIDAYSDQQWLDDYVVEEVLACLPAEVRGFVERTASLGTLTPELCDAVLQIDRSAALIDEAARRLVFARRDGHAGGVQYHHLFAESVARIAMRQITASERQAVRRRATAWWEARGQPETAVEHALAGDDLDTAVRLIKTILPGLLDVDWSHSVIYWLSRLPLSTIVGDSDLAYAYVWSQLLIGRAREAWQVFDHLERAWLDADDPVLRGRAMTCRIYSHLLLGHAPTPEMQELRNRALALLPEERAVERLHLWSGITADAYIGGDDEGANEGFRQAESCAIRLPPGQHVWFALNAIHRPNQAALRGRLYVAIALYHRALDRLPAFLRFWGGSLRYRLAAVHLERNELGLAREQAAHYESEIPTQRWEAWHPEAWIVSAQIRRAAGEIEEASALLDGAISALEEAGVVFVVPRARALQAAWWLADGRPELAVAWELSTTTDQLGWGRTYGLNNGHLTLVQLRAAEGDFAAASATARHLIAEGDRLKRWAEIVPFYVWDAVAQLNLGDESAALDALRAALKLAIPGRLVRSFFPPGADVCPFLAAARSELPPDEAAYVEILLGGVVESGGSPASPDRQPAQAPVPALRSPLSRREVDVLRLLEAGASNGQIAASLFLVEGTVKMHVSNLLAKLGVHNRTAAVIRARELGLLE